MSILPGNRVGPYEILSAIGAGGMGEVYRAHDGRLNRDIALKVLPESFGADRDRTGYADRSITAIRAFPIDLLRSDPRFADLLRRMNLQP